MKVIPALLSDNFDEFTRRLRQAEQFAEYVQVDIMDGIFVETRSFPVSMLNEVNTTLGFEVHLMVQDPLSDLKSLTNPSLKRVIFHIEACDDPQRFIAEARGRGLSVGLAVKPETPLEAFREPAAQVDAIVFLTVDPGRYGSPFRPDVIPKIKTARSEFPDKVIAVDGGVSLDNLERLFQAAVDYVYVGSRIFLHHDPAANYRQFVDRISRLEALDTPNCPS